jgi:hypothetical protein
MGELARQSGKAFGSTYLEHTQLDTFINGQWANVPGPTVIKAHMLGPVALGAIRSGEAKAVCTFRDPRDCVASDIVFLGQGLEASVARTAGTLEFLKYFQMTDHILLLRYENMMADRVREIRRIAEHLGITVDDAVVSRIDAETNIEATKKFCKQLKMRPSNQVLHIAAHRVDPQTHLHENHISNAMIGRWRTELSPEQGRWLSEYFSTWLLNLGYETQESLQEILSKKNVNRMPGQPVAAGAFAMGAGSAR